MRRREGAPPYVFYEGPPTANGRPGSHHVLARVFKDIFPRYKTMRGFYSYRKGGWDCHGLPVEIAVEQKLGFESKQSDIERYGIAEFNAPCRESVFEFLEDWTRADRADRLLGRPRRPLPHAGLAVHRVGLVGARAAVGQGPALRGLQGRARTARATAPRCPATRWPRATRTSRTRASTSAIPVTEAGGRAARGRRAARVDDDAVDARLQRRRGRRPGPDVRPHDRRPRAGRGARRARARRGRARSPTASPAGTWSAPRYEPPFPFIPALRVRRQGPHRPAGRLRRPPRTAPASSTPRSRSARTTSASAPSRGSNVINPVRADGTYDERIGPYAGRYVKDGRRRPDRGPARPRPAASRPSACCTPTRTAGAAARRCSTTPSRPGTSAPRSCSDRLLAANETVDWHPEHIKHGRFGRWLENNVDWAISAASATGARRCRSGATRRARPSHRLVRRAGGALRRHARGPAPPVRRRGRRSPRRPAASRCAACPR